MPDFTFAALMERRRSRRALGPCRLRGLVELLALATRARAIARHDPHERFKNPVVSAGALHSVEVIVLRAGLRDRAFRYKADSHELAQLRICHPDAVRSLRCKVGSHFPEAGGTILILMADRRRLEAVYEQGDTLAMRDAGAVLQALALTAEALGLGFCPAGMLGSEMIEAFGMDQREVFVCGVAVVGSVSDTGV